MKSSIAATCRLAFTSIFFSCIMMPAAAQAVGDIADGPPGSIAELTEEHFLVDGTVGSVKLLQFSDGTRTLYFVPMIHQAEPEFYTAIAGVVQNLKSGGADLFYEFVDFEAASHEDQLRIRAMLGFLPTPAFYAENVAEGLVAQDNEMFLGFPGGRDVNADLTPAELADAYESSMGKLEISDENRLTPISEFVMPTGDIAKTPMVIIDLRNEHLAEMIEAAPSDVVVLFGAAHGPGTLEELAARNPSWKRIIR
ncbi:hypothetical protein [uncultured Shimia sp.]|uniref:hypothetical protein n=1 Tax=uncultured Shimia sp. TaxID=573152 RepID=UPI00261DC701|nr:hypothetical protein [uncultured Shimia sp.]